MKVLIIGAGKTARELLRRLGKFWDVTLVDKSDERFPYFKKMKPVNRLILGDASSNLVLEEAGIEKTDFFVAVTNRDDINFEACVLAKQHRVKNIISMINDSDNLQKFRELGVRAICGSFMVAHQIEIFLESPMMLITSIGEGRGEVMEIKVPRNSPAIGKSMRNIHSKDWLVGAIYRKGEIIIPHKETTFQKDDLITIVGHSSLFKTISKLFTLDVPKFPLEYGRNILVPVRDEQDLETSVEEAIYLAKDFKASKIIFLVLAETIYIEYDAFIQKIVQTAEGRVEFDIKRVEKESRFEEIIIEMTRRENIGCVVTNLYKLGMLEKLIGPSKIVNLAHRISCPLLVGKKQFPYKNILVPTNATRAAELAAGVAIDIGRVAKANVATASVSDPVFMASKDSVKWAQTAMRHIRHIGEMHHFPIEEILLEGNPIKEIVNTAKDFNLIVIGSSTRGRSILNPNVGERIIHKAKSSVLIVTS
jgi:Trk K+ transport system NAD-binding subunit/nucleotide-binding universal stress UspA family protein